MQIYTEITSANTNPPARCAVAAAEDRIPVDHTGTIWLRRFHRRIPDEGFGQHAVITVAFFVRPSPDPRARYLPELAALMATLVRYTEYVLCDDPSVLGDPALSASGTVHYWRAEMTTLPNDHALVTDEDALLACETFDPATLTWDGYPTSHLPCEVKTLRWTANNYSPYCATHDTEPLFATAADTESAARLSFVCDKGRDRRYLVDTGTDGDPRPHITNLTGLRKTLHDAVTGRYYGEHHGELHLFYYWAPGKLAPLLCQLRTPEPGQSDGRYHLDDDENKPLLIPQTWDVIDASVDGEQAITNPQHPRIHLTTTITLNADA